MGCAHRLDCGDELTREQQQQPDTNRSKHMTPRGLSQFLLLPNWCLGEIHRGWLLLTFGRFHRRIRSTMVFRTTFRVFRGIAPPAALVASAWWHGLVVRSAWRDIDNLPCVHNASRNILPYFARARPVVVLTYIERRDIVCHVYRDAWRDYLSCVRSASRIRLPFVTRGETIRRA